MLARATNSAVQLAQLEALETREPWLAPACRRLRELTNAGFGDSLLALRLLEYLANAAPASETADNRPE